MRDGVKPFFEHPGPTIRKAQPLIDDPVLRERSRDKIGKVIKRKYLITEGHKVVHQILCRSQGGQQHVHGV